MKGDQMFYEKVVPEALFMYVLSNLITNLLSEKMLQSFDFLLFLNIYSN
jgi:hypothetical protein